MAEKMYPGRCRSCRKDDEPCMTCVRHNIGMALVQEARNAENAKKARGEETDPETLLNAIHEGQLGIDHPHTIKVKVQNKRKPRKQKKQGDTRVLPPTETSRAPHYKDATRQYTRVIPPPEVPVEAEDLPQGTCLVFNCPHEGKQAKKGFCNGCYTLMCHWSVRGKDRSKMVILPNDEQLKAFQEYGD